MIKTCPFKSTSHYTNIDCSSRCVMYNDNGCLVKTALETYIINNKPFEVRQPVDEELNELLESIYGPSNIAP